MADKIKILHVVGARPNFMKVATVLAEMKKSSKLHPLLCHTGQHYDFNMSQAFFQDLEIPAPDIYLGVGSGSHAEQTARIMLEFEKACIAEKPALIVVYGDVNSTLACSVVAAKLMIPIAHVEAGLRSFDKTMPEEINRMVTDVLSDFLFTTCADADNNLKREGVQQDKIFFVGNVMVDTLFRFRNKAARSDILQRLGLQGETGTVIDYAVLTLHRASNVDDKAYLEPIIDTIRSVAKKIPIIFPVHPRTRKQMEIFALSECLHDCAPGRVAGSGIYGVDPLGYLDFIQLMANSRFVLTDSGGLQEETTALGIPCLTMRSNTERPVTVTEGTNIMVGMDRDRIITESNLILQGKGKHGRIPAYWDGKASERIVRILEDKL